MNIVNNPPIPQTHYAWKYAGDRMRGGMMFMDGREPSIEYTYNSHIKYFKSLKPDWESIATKVLDGYNVEFSMPTGREIIVTAGEWLEYSNRMGLELKEGKDE